MREVGTKVCFIEVANEDPNFLNEQYQLVATSSPDYAGMDPVLAVCAMKSRLCLDQISQISHYILVHLFASV